jgi:predicted DNA-binding protein (MmcQ/YjbR family)
MDNERIREICLALPHVKETVNWGHHLVYWAGDRDLGGKMFAMTDLDGSGNGVLWFHCGAERFHELIENEGIIPSPYLARAFWVTVQSWNVLRPREIERELQNAHALIFAKLPARTRSLLEMPKGQRNKALASPKSGSRKTAPTSRRKNPSSKMSSTRRKLKKGN